MFRIAKLFGPTVALAGVDLEVRAGEILALVGENEAGKSTLMKMLRGAVAPDAGSPAEADARGVAMNYQELSLALHLTVTENIARTRACARALPRSPRRARARARRPRIDRAPEPLARGPGLDHGSQVTCPVCVALNVLEAEQLPSTSGSR
jgi:ABC-type sugar transport system ATPase subunit